MQAFHIKINYTFPLPNAMIILLSSRAPWLNHAVIDSGQNGNIQEEQKAYCKNHGELGFVAI